MLRPLHEVTPSLPWGRLVDPEAFSLVWFHPPPRYAGELLPRGITLAPHAAGLVVKAVWGWAAREGALSVGTVITWVGETSCSDRVAMVTLLSASGGESHLLTLAGGQLNPEDWIAYPRTLDVSI